MAASKVALGLAPTGSVLTGLAGAFGFSYVVYYGMTHQKIFGGASDTARSRHLRRLREKMSNFPSPNPPLTVSGSTPRSFEDKDWHRKTAELSNGQWQRQARTLAQVSTVAASDGRCQGPPYAWTEGRVLPVGGCGSCCPCWR